MLILLLYMGLVYVKLMLCLVVFIIFGVEGGLGVFMEFKKGNLDII